MVAAAADVERAAGPRLTEELGWDTPVALHGESRPGEREGRGFVLRLHADPACPQRLAADLPLVVRTYPAARAEHLCPRCCAGLVAASTSSVVAHLHRALATLARMARDAEQGPQPREIVHARALRYEACHLDSVHPAAAELRVRVAATADEVEALLRASLLRWDRGRR